MKAVTRFALVVSLAVVANASEAPATGAAGDLVTRGVVPLATHVAHRQQLSVAVTLVNRGARRIASSQTGLVLSRDAVRDGSDVRLGAVPVPALGAGESITITLTAAVPTVRPGIYHLVGCADRNNRRVESRETNNCRTARRTITVTRPLRRPPVVTGEVVSIPEDTTLRLLQNPLPPWAGLAVLLNDTDPDGSRLTVSAYPSVTHGSLMSSWTPGIDFRPDSDFSGIASVTYVVTDGFFAVPGTVTINVLPVNDPPDVFPDTFIGLPNRPMVFTVGQILANDSDREGQPLTVTSLTTPDGAISRQGDQVTFTPNQGFVGDARVDYVVSDGQDAATSSIMIRIAP